MRFDEADAVGDRPGAASIYAASLVASGIAFLLLLALLCLAAVWNDGSIATALSILVVGGFWGAVFTIFLAFLVVGPIGTAIGLALVRLGRPKRWHGAVNGAATGSILLALLVALSPDGYRNLGSETLIAAGALLSAGAVAGWMAQHWYLGWPVKPD